MSGGRVKSTPPHPAAKGVPGSVIVAKPFAPAQLITAISNAINQADMHLPIFRWVRQQRR
jgi:hypothetical protein